MFVESGRYIRYFKIVPGYTDIEWVRCRVKHDMNRWSLVDRILNATVDRYISVEKEHIISVKRVLCCCWNRLRYEGLLEADIGKVLEENPPRVVAFETVKGYVYVPVDGNHRIVVAEEKGLKKIKAEVSAIYPLPTTFGFLLYRDGVLWKPEGDAFKWLMKIRESVQDEEDLRLVASVLALRGITLYETI